MAFPRKIIDFRDWGRLTMDALVKPRHDKPMNTQWTLDPRLAADTSPLGDLPLSRVLLNNDAGYPWLILVPRRASAVELIDLAANDRAQLMDEIAQVSAALKDLTACHKLNVATLGNVVAQLHIHIIARFREDVAWPGPVWGKAPARPYDEAVHRAFVSDLKAALALQPRSRQNGHDE